MSVELQIILFAGFSGITVFFGGLLANFFNHHAKESPIKYEITHTFVAFGGGIILSALALVLIPQGMEGLKLFPLIAAFCIGAIIFFFIDRYLEKKGGQMSMLFAMLMDFIPESIALGALFAADPTTGVLLAIFIGIQNLPEAFNSFRDLVQSGFKIKTVLVIFFFLSFSGIIGAMLGHFFLSESPEVTAFLMVFASGGILYLLFQDIVPDSKLKNSWIPSLGATLGFVIGMIGEKII